MWKRIELRSLPALPMKAVIICDDPAFASNAALILARVGRQACVNVHWTTKSWTMNALNEFALAENALVEASDAHLILFPESQARSFPFWFFDWLGRWAAGRTIQDAAVGVIKDENATSFATPAFPELSTFAREHSLSFIVDVTFTTLLNLAGRKKGSGRQPCCRYPRPAFLHQFIQQGQYRTIESFSSFKRARC